MSTLRHCPTCGHEIPASSPSRLCPRCLLVNGLDATIEIGRSAPDDDAAKSSKETQPLERVRYLGDFELLQEIARGGMGVVFKARQVSLNRIVAVKMILAGTLADESAVRRFRQEAEAAAGLDHPNIVPVYEVGEHGDQHYFSMGFVDGQSLAARLASGPLAPREAAELIEQVARAVQFAHDKGIIHRDLKPANILLDRDGRPKVTDFGLAKVVTREQGLTETGQVLGTPGYMPPEQFDGKHVGPQADVYGLGAILYALLTGRPPFQAATLMETLQQVLDAEPAPARQLNPSVPRDLETIVKKCLEKWPEWRYSSAAELADELRRYLNGEPILARRTGLVENGIRWFRKQRRSVALAAGAVVATVLLSVVGAVGWAWYQDWRLGRVTLKTDRPPIVAELLNGRGELAVPMFTVPTQEPVAVPADEYRARFSQPLRLSQMYQMTVERGGTAQFAVNLDDQLVRGANGETVLNIERSYALVTRRGRTDVLLLDNAGIRRPGWPDGGETWSLKLNEPNDDDPLVKTPGLRWPWSGSSNYAEYSHPVFHPQLVRHAPDVDGDGVEDVIVAARHQAWIMAISGTNGKILWLAARGADLQTPYSKEHSSFLSRNPSAVLGEPQLVGDQDGDGVPDLLARFADTGSPAKSTPDRWLECLSSKSGKSLWRFDFAAAWFDMPTGTKPPKPALWYIALNGSSSGGGSWSNDHGNVVRQIGRLDMNGESHVAPYAPLFFDDGQKKLAVVVAGTKVVVIDIATGMPVGEPLDLGLPAELPPQLADLDGDQRPELIVVQPVLPTTPGAANSDLLVTAWPVGWTPRPSETFSKESVNTSTKEAAKGQDGRGVHPTWRHTITAQFQSGVKSDWPLVADLDGDGRREVIVPNRTPPMFGITKPWAEIELLDGATGESRWHRRLKTMDLQLDQMLVGPDIDGDGQRDLLVAALVDDRYDLYVDALSGRTGETLWWTSRRVGHSAWLDRIDLWEPGHDGWPQLLVRTTPEHRDRHGPQLFAISVGTGQFAGAAAEIDELQFAAADNSGRRDLFAMQHAQLRHPEQGGRLQAFRGVANERWRRLGGAWQVARDYDSDGQPDLVAVFPAGTPTLAAISGRDGRSLWRQTHDFGSQAWHPVLQPLDFDLDGDGTQDLIAHAGTQGGGATSPRTQFPVAAISGRTGAKLWSVEMIFGSLESVMFVEARDLDGDGAAEVIFSTVTDWDYPRKPITVSSAFAQHWLAVVEGRTGKFRWRQPLSVPYGLPGAVNRSEHSRGAHVRPVFADFNRDSVLDIVTLAEVPESPGKFELRACSGRDGTTLRRRSFAANSDLRDIWQNAVTPEVVDLDGDGQPELIGLEYFESPTTTGPQRSVRVFALDGTGREWTWEAPVESQCGQAGANTTAQALKPRPLTLRQRDGRPLLVVALWHGHSRWPPNEGRLAVLDHAGRLIAERPVARGIWDAYRIWVDDVNHDGNDDVLLMEGDKLRALTVRPRTPQTPQPPPQPTQPNEKNEPPAAASLSHELVLLWETSLPTSEPRRVVEIRAATNASPPLVIVQAGPNLLAYSGATGERAWTNVGPQPLAANGSLLTTFAQPISETSALFQWGEHLAVCRDTALTPAEISSPPKLGQRQRDPRALRPSPWVADGVDRSRAVLQLIWGLTLATFLLLVPGGVLLRMIERRQWSLQTLLLLPAIVGIVIVLTNVPMPQRIEPQSLQRIRIRIETAMAFSCLPIFFAILLNLARQHRWRPVLIWCGVTLAITVIAGIFELQINARRLAPGEQFVIGDLDVLLAYGIYFTAWIATLIACGYSVTNWFRNLVAKRG